MNIGWMLPLARGRLGAAASTGLPPLSDYQIKNLREVEDMAVKHGFSETQEARFPREELGAQTTGLAYHVVRPGQRQGF
jgi:hypothetical protein